MSDVGGQLRGDRGVPGASGERAATALKPMALSPTTRALQPEYNQRAGAHEGKDLTAEYAMDGRCGVGVKVLARRDSRRMSDGWAGDDVVYYAWASRHERAGIL